MFPDTSIVWWLANHSHWGLRRVSIRPLQSSVHADKVQPMFMRVSQTASNVRCQIRSLLVISLLFTRLIRALLVVRIQPDAAKATANTPSVDQNPTAGPLYNYVSLETSRTSDWLSNSCNEALVCCSSSIHNRSILATSTLYITAGLRLLTFSSFLHILWYPLAGLFTFFNISNCNLHKSARRTTRFQIYPFLR